VPGTNKTKRSLSGRDDQRLAVLLDEAAEWFVKGTRFVILGRAVSLPQAIDGLVKFGASDQVVSLAGGPFEDIVVFSPQLGRLVAAHARATANS
jgi:hypothetical protein